MAGKKLLLVDCDCGLDDAQALMMALGAPNVHVLGITCCHGNTSLDNACRNVLRVLKACKRTEIPVFRGTSSSLLGQCLDSSAYHGKDGLGDVPDPSAPGLEHLQSEHAVNAMVRIVTEHTGQISLVALGPLTNVAMASKMDPTFSTKLKDLYIMGGNMEAVGNVTVCGEFNFATDPEAASIVLNQFSCPTYIATWEYTLRNQLPWKFFEEWVNLGTEKACFMKTITRHSGKYKSVMQNEAESHLESAFNSCDSYAMATAIDTSVVTEYIRCGVSVELQGLLTRGMMVLDSQNLLGKENHAFVMKKCDIEKFKRLMMAALL
ncbi:inosine-uridine preferring nucleoside hydrolase-like [Leucoraja erinacea]|uniref:inosine-uridine preferring nucleoside hydrolase-like n=1 Tax=Leucoraja erinaceus TaxID=7782 RepID=UPI002454CCED|nr:inosine-uridine preferring nucleoside hydrolase-like [Leucoraja erinacea]XP_055492498.1 inosine-uridine preferring nucleoside hydrolase-like [Leucoraja erinacea]XP_055492499.1 inosine-uridine preferring nucleoside hydrolase-like [Leucoraja erinacea]